VQGGVFWCEAGLNVAEEFVGAGYAQDFKLCGVFALEVAVVLFEGAGGFALQVLAGAGGCALGVLDEGDDVGGEVEVAQGSGSDALGGGYVLGGVAAKVGARWGFARGVKGVLQGSGECLKEGGCVARCVCCGDGVV
jgi:hypothetical protein